MIKGSGVSSAIRAPAGMYGRKVASSGIVGLKTNSVWDTHSQEYFQMTSEVTSDSVSITGSG